MPFESKLTGFKSLTYRFCFKDLCFYYLFEKSCTCMLHCFPYHCLFFFFVGWGGFLVKQSLGYSNSSIVLCSPVSTI